MKTRDLCDRDRNGMIAQSVDRASFSPSWKIYEVVKRIPAGCVATYGQVAQLAGNRKMAQAEGIAVTDGKVDLSRYQWAGEP